MKNTYLAMLIGCAVCSIVTTGFSQESNYYANAFGTEDEVLKQALHAIIKNHSEFTYTSSSTDVWDVLKETDRDTVNPDNVILIYSGRSINAAQEYNSAQGWSREHVWAKSRGDFGTSPGPGTDVHHLRPCDVSVNSTRSNRNFDACVTCQDVIDNGFNTGSKKDANLWTFEPPDAVKGDVARMIFYMAVRYEGGGGELDLELTSSLLDKLAKDPLQSKLTTFLNWNNLDPVSDWERNRNEIIYSDYQGNRNPFIDHPEIAEYIWGDSVGVAWLPTFPTGIDEMKEEGVLVYPNPARHSFSIKGAYTKLELFNTQGQFILRQNGGKNSIINVAFLPKGIYFMKVTSISGEMVIQRMLKI
ncbi:MAG: endonuclease I [Salibacteraceae bacterium]